MSSLVSTAEGTLPSEIGFLAGLTTFDMGFNSLSGIIPVEIGCLTNLESLYVDNNRLTGKLLKSKLSALMCLLTCMLFLSLGVANTFGTMNALTVLDIQSNLLFGRFCDT